MNKAPAFQFYADDFIGGTITMSHEERGLYVLALCIQWGQGSLAHDDIERLGDPFLHEYNKILAGHIDA